ncbi:MAG: cytochrome b [Sphaerospermopsis sp. SIO1G2]|nr:cytochrome b [Sphaerospermopsis sp. SIO1G1]NET70623.1 cytochrome b [Sphaerospermopsis sp. SIO1G2]
MNTANTPSKPRQNSAFKHLMSIHWWMSIGYLILFLTGPIMARLPRELFIRSPMYDFHKSIGTIAMAVLTWRILVLLRVWWRKYTKRFPKFTPAWLKTVALHTSLYIFMWVVPITGFLLSNSFKSNNVRVFGFVIPDIFPENSEMVSVGRNLHFWLGYTFLAFTILHTIEQRKVVRSLWKKFTKSIKPKKN